MQHRCVLIVLLLAHAAAAQEARVEEERPLDQAGRLLEITPALRRELGLFPGIEGFQTARLFQAEDSTWVLEIASQRQGRLGRERRSLSAEAVDSLRRDLDLRLRRIQGGSRLDQSARGELIAGQLLLSLGFYGPAMPTILGLSGGRPAVGCYMLTTAAGFYLPYRLTRRASVTPTHRQLTSYGAWRGIGAGLLLEDLLLAGQGNERSGLAGAMAGSIASSLLGYRAVSWREYTRGQGELCGVMGDFGALAGAGGAYLAGLYGSGVGKRRLGHAVVLAGGGMGLLGGDRLGRHQEYSPGDAHVLRAGGLLGAVMALPLVRLTRTDHPKAYTGGAVTGMGAGIIATNHLLQGQDFSLGEGMIVTSGEAAGGLLGLGLCYLIDTRGHFDELAYLTSAAAGSAAGFSLTFKVFSRQAKPCSTRPCPSR